MGKGKAPADQFYFGDFERDVAEHGLEICGAWILILGRTWYSKTRGKVTKSLQQWANVLRVSEEKTLSILHYLKDEGIADIPEELPPVQSVPVTFCNERVTVINRRQHRKWKDDENNRLRQQRFRNKQKNNAEITPVSSSSPSKKSFDSFDLSFLKSTARKCYSQCGGGCGATWTNHKDSPDSSCHHCQKFKDVRKP